MILCVAVFAKKLESEPSTITPMLPFESDWEILCMCEKCSIFLQNAVLAIWGKLGLFEG